MVGRTLAHYRILQQIGSGGMGDVYLAEDTELDRKVALKVLPAELAESEERRARFKREAKAVAALNHPNIVTVYSVEEADGVHFMTMELVKGKTLAEILPRQGFSFERFFDIAAPLADAVAAAHERGIVHRDLKPRNVMLTEDGRVKVLDFGLAKPAGGFAGTDVASDLPTEAKTEQGVIVGTYRYMSPEQAQGKAVDARSDIFSLGIVFYEMLTGQRPFEGDTPTEVLSSIIKDVPTPISEIRSGIPRELSRMVRRCLEKDPSRRLQSALDLRNELEELRREADSGELFADARPAPRSRSRLGVALWLAGAAVGIFVLVRLSGVMSTQPPRVVVPRLVNPVQVTSAAGVENHPTWSADGGRIAYDSDQSGNLDIWVTQPTGGAAANFTADHRGFDRDPAWSPDGSQIAFVSERDGGGMYLMPAIGGLPVRISSASIVIANPVWSSDATELAYIVVEPDMGIEIVSLSTRESRRLAIPGTPGNRWDLSWSPDGRFFAYVRSTARRDDPSRLWVLRASDGEAFDVTDGRTGDWCPMWSKDGRTLLFLSNRGGSVDLWQRGIAPDGNPEGEAVALTVGVGMLHAALTPDGTKLAYSKGRSVANVWRVPILADGEAVWADAEQLTFDQALILMLDLSPDGEQLIVDSDRGGNRDLWIVPVGGGQMRQVTNDRAADSVPRWSPDGKRIVYWSSRSGNPDIWVTTVDGGPGVPLTDHPESDLTPSWSPDGREIAFHSSRTGATEIFVVPAAGGEPRQITHDGVRSFVGQWSPDGAWIAFSSNREDDVRRLWRVPASGTGPPQRLTNGPGTWFRWSLDGTRIYYKPEGNESELWVVTLGDGVERPVTRFQGKPGSLGNFALAEPSLYFTWNDDLGDIWVMDVVTEEIE